MLTPEALWAVAKVIQAHSRFRVGALSLAALVTFRLTLWKLFLYWRAEKKFEERKIKASKVKQLVREQCSTADYEDILTKHVDELLKDLRNGALSPVDVLRAYQKKALKVDERINAITEPIPEAMELARELDQTADKSKLLFGLPVSLKENIAIGGHDSTLGISLFVDKIMKEDSVIVKVLKKHGAVPFVRTNIPQTMMSYCSSNPVFGETSNPVDTTRAPGGSSSGEAALIGGGGSLIGIGSDIGGSVRIPAAFCGCYSLKVTNLRVSSKGLTAMGKGNIAIKPCLCPMARDLPSLVLLSKAVMCEEMYALDPVLPIQPFDEERMNKTGPMRIGYYTFDGNLRCQPPVVRAVMESKDALEKMGHTLIPVDLARMCPKGYPMGQYYGRIIAADRFQTFKTFLGNDKREKGMKAVISLFALPVWLTQLASFVMSFKDKLVSDMLGGAGGFKSVFEYRQHIGKFVEWQEEFMDAWLAMDLDAMVCPVWPAAAPKKDYIHLLLSGGVYSTLYNALNFPSGVIPVTKVTKEDVDNTKNPSIFKPSGFLENLFMKSVDGSEGMPLAVQCVALPFREETCLRVMRELEKGLELGK